MNSTGHAIQNASSLSWKSALGLSSLVVYGPFIAMSMYALVCVPCSHCKTTAWTLLPCAPGLMFVEVGRRWLNVSRPGDALGFALAFMAALAVVVVLAGLIRRGPLLRWTCVAFALAASALAAWGTLAMIRS